jgi:hypothetical protein
LDQWRQEGDLGAPRRLAVETTTDASNIFATEKGKIMSTETRVNGPQQPELRPVKVVFGDGSSAICANPEDAELVLDAERRLYEGVSSRRLPRRTLVALERAGLNFRNSVLYRSAMHNLEESENE